MTQPVLAPSPRIEAAIEAHNGQDRERLLLLPPTLSVCSPSCFLGTPFTGVA
jgi:hypothetical protein